jgi:hypothetical protein
MSNFLFPEKILRLITPLDIVAPQNTKIAEITGRKLNHSTRKTFVSTLLHADRQNTEVSQLGGWKSVATLL